MKQAAQRRSVQEKGDADALAQQFAGVTLTFYRKTGEKEHLFGSVTSADIAEALEQKGLNVDRRKIQLDDPIRALGEFKVPIKLHRDVTTTVKVVVEKEAAA
jgi:large subunit ribosomal protein L9